MAHISIILTFSRFYLSFCTGQTSDRHYKYYHQDYLPWFHLLCGNLSLVEASRYVSERRKKIQNLFKITSNCNIPTQNLENMNKICNFLHSLFEFLRIVCKRPCRNPQGRYFAYKSTYFTLVETG